MRTHLQKVRAAGAPVLGGGGDPAEEQTLARLAGTWEVRWGIGSRSVITIRPDGTAATGSEGPAGLTVAGASVLLDPGEPGRHVTRLTPTDDGRVMAEQWRSAEKMKTEPPRHYGSGVRQDG